MLTLSIANLFPGINFETECIVEDAGNGPYIAQWHRPEPQPTPAEIEAAYPAAQAAAARAAIPTVSPRQIRQALTIVGLRASVEAAVAASDQDTKDWWEFATVFERNHVKVVAMIAALGVSEQQADDLWLLAASL